MDTISEKLEVVDPFQTIPTPKFEPSDASEPIHLTGYFVLALISSIIPILALIIGLYFKGQCPMDEQIPHFMVVSGSCSLVLTFLVLLFILINACSSDYNHSTSESTSKCCSINCWMILAAIGLIIFMIIWTAFGCGWIFTAKGRVQFRDRTNKATYCHPVLYYSSFVFAIGSLVLSFLFCCILRIVVPRKRGSFI